MVKRMKILNTISFNYCVLVCLLSLNQVEVRTLQMAPEGPILLELTNQSSRSLRARWTAPPRPNGNLGYTLYYKSKGNTYSQALSLFLSDICFQNHFQ